MRRTLLALATVAIAFGTPEPAASQPLPEDFSSLGTNLGYIADWSSEYAFVDCFKQSRRWVSGSPTAWEDGRALDLDEHGWVRSLLPDQVARTVMNTAAHRRYPAGEYVVTYEGQGTLRYFGGARLASSGPGRDVVAFEPGRGPLGLAIVSTGPEDHLRNIAVRMPESGDEPLFHPHFLRSIKKYKQIRFMNWQAVCNWMLGRDKDAPGRWEDRPRATDARWNLRGVPLEVSVALANRLDADAWFSLPHLADDDYVRRFCEQLRDTLRPKLKIYLEYSNEVWNPVFRQTPYARERGLELGLAADRNDDPQLATLRWYALRTAQVMRIALEVLGPERLVRVIAVQAVSPWSAETCLSFRDTATAVDALAVAPYFHVRTLSPEELARVQTMTLDEMFHELSTVSVPMMVDFTRRQAAVAARYGLRLVAYEAGQHLVGQTPLAMSDPAVNALFDAANRDPRMGQLYRRYLDGLHGAGLSLVLHLGHCDQYNRYGRFGSLEYLTQPRAEAPKFDALQRYLEDSRAAGLLR